MALRENPYQDMDRRLANADTEKNYTPSVFKDRIVEEPMRFVITEEVGTDGKTYSRLEWAEGDVLDEGTDLSAKTLGNMDMALAILYEWRKQVEANEQATGGQIEEIGSSIVGINDHLKILTDFDHLKSANNYDFKEEVIGQTTTGQDLYKFTTTILGPDGSTLATRVTTEAEGAGPGLYVFDTVTTIDGVAYHERYTETANGGNNREVSV